MSLDIGAALREGGRRLATPSGVQLIGAFLVVGVIERVVVQSFWSAYAALLASAGAEVPAAFPTGLPLAVETSLGLVLGGWLLVAVLGEAVRIVGVRGMVREEPSAISSRLASRNLGGAVANGFVGGIVVQVLVVIGIVLLVVPGIFLAVAFFFVRQEIAVEDRNFVEAMERSWVLTDGTRIEVFVIGLVLLTVVAGVVVVPSTVLGELLGQQSVVPPLVSAGLQAVAATFGVATASRAYVQLRDAADGEEAAGVGDEGRDDEADEWNDPPGVDI